MQRLRLLQRKSNSYKRSVSHKTAEMRSLCFIWGIMEYKTKPSGHPSDYYAIGLVITGIVFWAVTFIHDSYIALYQLASVLCIGAAMYFLIRYRLTVFRFRIEGRNGSDVDIRAAMAEELDFVVEKMRGKDGVAMARLSLDQLKSAKTVKYVELKELTKEMSLYRYHPNMSPEEGALIVFSDRERDIAIFTDIPTDILAFLERIASYNLTDSAE